MNDKSTQSSFNTVLMLLVKAFEKSNEGDDINNHFSRRRVMFKWRFSPSKRLLFTGLIYL